MTLDPDGSGQTIAPLRPSANLPFDAVLTNIFYLNPLLRRTPLA